MTLLFDFGGTLDTHGIHWFDMFAKMYDIQSTEIQYEQFKQCYISVERQLEHFRIIAETDNFETTLWKKMQLHGEQMPSLRCHIRSAFDSVCKIVCSCVSSSTKILQLLHERYEIAVVSNFYGNLATVLKHYRMDDCFDDVIDSTVVGLRKPDKRIYQLALQRMKSTAKDAVMIGDSLNNDILPCRDLGMNTVWLHRDATSLLKLPHSEISSLNELITLFAISNPPILQSSNLLNDQ